MKPKIIIILILLLVVLGIIAARSKSEEARLKPVETTISGVVKDVVMSAKIIIVTTTDEKDVTLVLDSTSKLHDESGGIVNLIDIKQGMSIRAIGVTTPSSVIPTSITIVSRPPEGAGIGDPCPGVISEENSSVSCRISVGSRITITLPSASYSKSALTIAPANAIQETFGASTQNDRWTRTFEAVQPGKVTVTVPTKNKAVTAFKATLDVFGVAPVSPMDAPISEPLDTQNMNE